MQNFERRATKPALFSIVLYRAWSRTWKGAFGQCQFPLLAAPPPQRYFLKNGSKNGSLLIHSS
jgi:hypothetical protein